MLYVRHAVIDAVIEATRGNLVNLFEGLSSSEYPPHPKAVLQVNALLGQAAAQG